MLRSLVASVYTCSCRAWTAAATRVPGLSDAAPLWRGLHLTSGQELMSKEVRSKKKTISRATEEKVEKAIDEKSFATDELIGMESAGLLTPTLETHSMLVGGIPYNQLPVVYIKSTTNNCHITIADHKGTTIQHTTCGVEGFRNVKKSTNVAAQASALAIGKRVIKRGLTHVRVVVKGLGAGRMASIKGLQMAGLQITSITDNTMIKMSNRYRSRKPKRL